MSEANIPLKVPVVLDKSYLQAASRAHIFQLLDTHRLLMSEALLYEILSMPADYLACFSKFPSKENPVDLVFHIGSYLQKEIYSRRPVPRPSTQHHKLRFQFNPSLLDTNYKLPSDAF